MREAGPGAAAVGQHHQAELCPHTAGFGFQSHLVQQGAGAGQVERIFDDGLFIIIGRGRGNGPMGDLAGAKIQALD